MTKNINDDEELLDDDGAKVNTVNKDELEIPDLSDDDFEDFVEQEESDFYVADNRIISDPSTVLTEENKAKIREMEVEWRSSALDFYPTEAQVDKMIADSTVQDIEFMYYIITHLIPQTKNDELQEMKMCVVLGEEIPDRSE